MSAGASHSRRAAALAVLLLAAGAAPDCRAQHVLDTLGERLTFVSAEGTAWAKLSSMSDLTVYAPDTPAPGLLFSDESVFVAPRLSFSVDAGMGGALLAHARLRIDRGFDPGSEEDGDLRLDEYYLEANAGPVRVRAGKFATAFGAWVDRHLSWDNPLITAPAIYGDMLTIKDKAAPADLAEQAGRRDAVENKAEWVPMIWGPSYATGLALSAGTGPLDLTIEAKNAALSSRPAVWDDRDYGDGVTLTGRLGWRPAPSWSLGISASRGAYLQERAQATLPAGTEVEDLKQRVLGLDLGYEHRRLQVWAELVRTEFEVPRAGDLEALAGFVELRYKAAPRIWVAGRWNQSRFDDLPGLDLSWDRDLRRLDLALGYRHDAHLQAKLEYSVGDQSGADTAGNRLIAAQVVLWF